MSEPRYYLSVGKEKREPEGDGYVAVITEGLYGTDDEVTVCSVEIVQSVREAQEWFYKMDISRPWEPRN